MVGSIATNNPYRQALNANKRSTVNNRANNLKRVNNTAPVVTNNPYRKVLNTAKRKNTLNKNISYYKTEIEKIMDYLRNNPGGLPNASSSRVRTALSYQNKLKSLEEERKSLQGGKRTRKRTSLNR